MNTTKNTKEKAFTKNILTEDEIMEREYYSAPAKTEKAAAKEIKGRPGVPVVFAREKEEKKKTRKSRPTKKTLVKKVESEDKLTTKPRSFPNDEVEKIALEVPKDLVKKMRFLVVQKESRFNIEAAAAFTAYLQRHKGI